MVFRGKLYLPHESEFLFLRTPTVYPSFVAYSQQLCIFCFMSGTLAMAKSVDESAGRLIKETVSHTKRVSRAGIAGDN